MSVCLYCGAQESLPFKCKFCGGLFCGEHRLPENHECVGLKKFKEERSKSPEKWIYEPFHEKHKRKVGREVQKPLEEKVLRALEGINTGKVLYAILVFILLFTIWRALG